MSSKRHTHTMNRVWVSSISLGVAAALTFPYALLWFSRNLQAAGLLVWPVVACLGILIDSAARLLRNGRGAATVLRVGTPVIFIFVLLEVSLYIAVARMFAHMKIALLESKLWWVHLEVPVLVCCEVLYAIGYFALIRERRKPPPDGDSTPTPSGANRQPH